MLHGFCGTVSFEVACQKEAEGLGIFESLAAALLPISTICVGMMFTGL